MLLNTPTEEGNKEFRKLIGKFYSMEKFYISILPDDVNILLRSLTFFIEDNSEHTSEPERKHTLDLANRIEEQIIKTVQSTETKIIPVEANNGTDN